LLGTTGYSTEGRSGLGCSPSKTTEANVLHYLADRVSNILRNVRNNLSIDANPALYPRSLSYLRFGTLEHTINVRVAPVRLSLIIRNVRNKLPINANPVLYPRSL